MSMQDLVARAWHWIATAGGVTWHWITTVDGVVWHRALTTSASAYSALFSGGALLIAAGAYWRQVDQARRAQASMVTLHRRATEQVGPPDFLIAHNYSDLPIFDVKIRLGRQQHLLEVQGESDEGTKFYTPYPVMPPHGHGTFGVEAGVNPRGARLEFHDSAHRRWRRGLHGELRELNSRRLLRWRR